MWTRALRQKAFYGEVTGMQMRKLAVAVIFLALAGSTYAAGPGQIAWALTWPRPS